MKKLLNINKIEKMASLAFINCIRLHKDSIFLFTNGSYPSAFFTSVISLEEFGKVLWLSDVLFHTRGDEMDRAGQEMWIESIFSHQRKQGIFAHEFMMELPKPFLKFIRENKIESEKQNSIYVGLVKKGRKINFDGKLTTPFRFDEKKAKRQITLLNDALLIRILGTIKGVFGIDSEEVEELMTRDLFMDLRSSWEHISPTTKKKIIKLEAFDDEK